MSEFIVIWDNPFGTERKEREWFETRAEAEDAMSGWKIKSAMVKQLQFGRWGFQDGAGALHSFDTEAEARAALGELRRAIGQRYALCPHGSYQGVGPIIIELSEMINR